MFCHGNLPFRYMAIYFFLHTWQLFLLLLLLMANLLLYLPWQLHPWKILHFICHGILQSTLLCIFMYIVKYYCNKISYLFLPWQRNFKWLYLLQWPWEKFMPWEKNKDQIFHILKLFCNCNGKTLWINMAKDTTKVAIMVTRAFTFHGPKKIFILHMAKLRTLFFWKDGNFRVFVH